MTTGGYYVPVVTTGRFSDAPGSIYRSILSSCRYYMEDFDYCSILVDSGSIVQCGENTMDISSNMSHSQMLGKFEYGGGPIFKVVLEC